MANMSEFPVIRLSNIRKPFSAGPDSILVIIPSYKDPECQWTVKNLYQQATHPERIFVAICFQGDEADKAACFTEPFPYPDQVRVKYYSLAESRGAGWARAEAFSLYQGETYTLQMDSHMRFESGWDEYLIDTLKRCPAVKPILTQWPDHYDLPDILQKNTGVNRIRIDRLAGEKDATLVHLSREIIAAEDERSGIYPTAICVAGFVFAKSEAFLDVPIDPYLHFYADELTHSARWWTHGYDLFQADRNIAYHNWVTYSGDKVPPYKKPDAPEVLYTGARTRHIMGVDYSGDERVLIELDRYGHGEARSLESYWDYLGVDWEARSLSPLAKEGLWHKLKEGAPEPIFTMQEASAIATDEAVVTPRRLPKIFVQIAAYRDPECQWTVKDLFEKAAHPEQITVGICWQSIQDEDQDCFEVITRPAQVRTVHFDARESKGACWARHQTQTLWQGEEFTLQVDAHMRFEDHWDSKLLAMYHAIGNPKSVMTTYPPGYTPPEKYGPKPQAYKIVAKEFNNHHIFTMTSRRQPLDNLPERPPPGAFLGACFLFGPASIIKDVPYDPYLYFFGEEISLAVRLWTHGYDIHYPNLPIAYHDWQRNVRKRLHFKDHQTAGLLNEQAFARVRYMLEGREPETPELRQYVRQELEKYGLGKVRTLAQYEAFSGVSFVDQTIDPKAREGIFPVSPMPSMAVSQAFAASPAPRPMAGNMPLAVATAKAPIIISREDKKLIPPQELIRNHGAIKTFESKEFVVYDDFLPEEEFEALHKFTIEGNYKHINTNGPVSRVWNIDNGFPLRSEWNAFYNTTPPARPEKWHYPTKMPVDRFIEYVNRIAPQVGHIIGAPEKDWKHFSVSGWLYPQNTGLSLHNDGAGIYSGAYVYFLNKQWRVHWGGLLLAIDSAANEAIEEHKKRYDAHSFHRQKWLHESEHDDYAMEAGYAHCIMPKRNRIVFIAPEAYHIVTKVLPTAGDNVRMSFAGFFNRKKHASNDHA